MPAVTGDTDTMCIPSIYNFSHNLPSKSETDMMTENHRDKVMSFVRKNRDSGDAPSSTGEKGDEGDQADRKCALSNASGDWVTTCAKESLSSHDSALEDTEPMIKLRKRLSINQSNLKVKRLEMALKASLRKEKKAKTGVKEKMALRTKAEMKKLTPKNGVVASSSQSYKRSLPPNEAIASKRPRLEPSKRDGTRLMIDTLLY